MRNATRLVRRGGVIGAGLILAFSLASGVAAPPMATSPYPVHLSTNAAADLWLNWTAGQYDAIVNGDFETGTLAGWTAQNTAPGDTIINNGSYDPPSDDGNLPPYAGSFSSISFQTGPGTQTLFQDFLIPEDSSSVFLTWVDRIRNHADDFANEAPIQQYRVELRNPVNNALLSLLYTTRPGDVHLADWTIRKADLTPFRGQRVRLAFYQDQNRFFFNLHLDNVSVKVRPSRGFPADVYFGTNAVLGTADRLGSTTNFLWLRPSLQPDTTYFWRVDFREGPSQTTGPVWSFKTRPPGPVTHFAWNPIPSPPTGQPVPVGLTARDAGNFVVTNFNGPVNLSGFSPGAPPAQSLLAELPYSVYVGADRETFGYSFTPSSDLIVTAIRHYSGDLVSIWSESERLVTSQMLQASPGIWSETPLALPAPLLGGRSYRIGVFSSVPSTNYARMDWSGSFSHGAFHQGYYGAGTLFPTNHHAARWWYVDLKYTPATGAAVPVSPSVTTAFTNGAWMGAVTLGGGGTPVVLRAVDSSGNSGLSAPFSTGQ
jgi:hypothetical protein